MKKSLALFAVLLITTSLFAQREHHGFYLSLAAGPAWGTVNGSDNQGNSLDVEGAGAELDLQLGGTIIPGLILHGTITAKSVVGPTINGVSVSKDYSLSETMLGVGVTHYTPKNIFFTGNFGVGSFAFADAKTSTSTDNGFSFLLKAGKEWWLSKKIGLGAAFTYGGTSLTNTEGNITEKWKSNRLGVVLQLTID
jgi:hypothetical protein